MNKGKEKTAFKNTITFFCRITGIKKDNVNNKIEGIIILMPVPAAISIARMIKADITVKNTGGFIN